MSSRVLLPANVKIESNSCASLVHFSSINQKIKNKIHFPECLCISFCPFSSDDSALFGIFRSYLIHETYTLCMHVCYCVCRCTYFVLPRFQVKEMGRKNSTLYYTCVYIYLYNFFLFLFFLLWYIPFCDFKNNNTTGTSQGFRGIQFIIYKLLYKELFLKIKLIRKYYAIELINNFKLLYWLKTHTSG